MLAKGETTVRWFHEPKEPAVGDMWYDTKANLINIWTGKDWIHMDDSKRRFQIVGYHSYVDKHVAIIVNFSWWSRHSQEVIAWLDQSCPGHVKGGTTLQFETEEELTLFAMRWCGGH